MKPRILSSILFFTLPFVFAMCSPAPKQQNGTIASGSVGKQLESINRYLVQKETKNIKNYVDSLGLDMQMTQTGLWYKVESQGTGEKPQFGDVVSISYQIHLLDGTLCYSSDSSGVKSFTIGRSQELRGINEAVLKIGTLGEIDLVIPRHLGKGLMGDLKKIPPMQTLRCRLKLLQIAKF